MSSDRQTKLIERLDRAKVFLSQNIERQPVYGDLIATLESIGDRLKSSQKLTAKIVSPSSSLAETLLAKHEANASLRSLYEFHAVAPISQISQILQHCDLICLVYEGKHVIRDHHRKLIELAQKQNIDLLLLVNETQYNLDQTKYADWQQDLDTIKDDLLQLPCDRFIDLDRSGFDLYQRSLIDLATVLKNNRLLRIEAEIVREIKSFFNQQITNLWQSIKQVNTEYFAGEPLSLYQQQFRQNIQTLNQFRQQSIRDIKQAINHEKAELLNPFTTDSLIFNFQQLINSARVKIVTETDQTYLYLSLADFPQQPLLHDYVLELCQQRVDRILDSQWSQINYVYGNRGLNTLVERTNQDLERVNKLIDSETKLLSITASHPKLNLAKIIDPYCFAINNRIPFDYNFTQSSWFRLLVSALVGTAIYLSTWLYLGTGKYIGFMIIIFQIINLITGQNIKKAKLKQHTKELKRVVDRECQSLVRTVINYLTQTLIVTVDRECQFYQQEYTEAIAIAQNKLDLLKQDNEEQKLAIENLKQDRDKIIAPI